MQPCPSPLPDELLDPIRQFAHLWLSSPARPSPDHQIAASWDGLLDEWVNSDLPLFIRRSTLPRGSIVHHESGRKLVPSDNTPAHWALSQALEGLVPTLDGLRSGIRQIPVAFALKKSEREKSDYTAKSADVRLNAQGWKVCHIDPVKLGRGSVETRSVSELKAHFLRFMSPSNMLSLIHI